jgi:hypothetical protein
MRGLDSELFQRFDALESESRQLSTAAADLAKCVEQESSLSRALGSEQSQMRQVVAKEQEHEKKLHKVEHNAVAALLKGGKSKAIATEEQKVSMYHAQHDKLAAEIAANTEQLNRLRREDAVLQEKVSRKQMVDVEMESIIDYALSTTPATRETMMLHGRRNELTARAAENRQLMSDTTNAINQYQAAVNSFSTALMSERRAQNDDMGAMMFGDGVFGMMEQQQRDMDMQRGMMYAQMATQQMMVATTSVTPLMASRDPAMAQTLRQVPAGFLHGQNFAQVHTWRVHSKVLHEF